jgi:hypothetical protein
MVEIEQLRQLAQAIEAMSICSGPAGPCAFLVVLTLTALNIGVHGGGVDEHLVRG